MMNLKKLAAPMVASVIGLSALPIAALGQSGAEVKTPSVKISDGLLSGENTLPAMPGLPAVEFLSTPEIPALPQLPAFPGYPATPALPEIPAVGGPSTPALPGIPTDAVPQLPTVGLPNLPAVPDTTAVLGAVNLPQVEVGFGGSVQADVESGIEIR